ncbi:MAG: pyrophosphokinae [Fusobacteriaceae bacterium]|jgi:ppGpp synthetase/RelA/SpoT-type nucleotidyltranferase|nr:hypothetical protein [Fusobacteriales bacterium]MDN5304430.1 pyrophosphokinae [Fusobacteriaceae bacterium]
MNINILDIQKKYENNFSEYEKFANFLKERLNYLFLINNFTPAKFETRVKSIKSFIKKVEKKYPKYKDPFHDVTDIIGLRVITYYNTEIDDVVKILKDNFEIDYENSSDKENLLEYDKMGYISVHYVCKFADNNTIYPYKFEVQIRSLLQHVWASIDHKLRYKTYVEIPKEIKRKLFRLSALLEVADSEFASIKEEIEMLKKFYENNFDNKKYNLRIDISSINYYLKYNNERIKNISKNFNIERFKSFETAKSDNLERKLLHFSLKTNKHFIYDLDNFLTTIESNQNLIIDLLDDEIIKKLTIMINSSCSFLIAFIILIDLEIDRVKKILNLTENQLLKILKLREILNSLNCRDIIIKK